MIIAIAALVAGIIFAYQKSETFRTVVQAAFRGVVDAGEKLWDILSGVFRFITNAWLTVAGVIIDGAAKAFGWVPGIGDKLRGAAEKFHQFKDNVNAALNGVKDSVTVTTRIEGGQEAINKIARLRWELDNIPRSVTVGVINKVQTLPTFAGGVRNFAGGLAIVGEEGPELVRLPANSDVYPAGQTRQMMGSPRAAGGVIENHYHLHAAGSIIAERDAVRMLRQGIRDLDSRRGE